MWLERMSRVRSMVMSMAVAVIQKGTWGLLMFVFLL
jgi:hypothetical protein